MEEELNRLRAENAALKALLSAHGIASPVPVPPKTIPIEAPSTLSPAEKVKLFRRLFRGRVDVYPVRWESCVFRLIWSRSPVSRSVNPVVVISRN